MGIDLKLQHGRCKCFANDHGISGNYLNLKPGSQFNRILPGGSAALRCDLRLLDHPIDSERHIGFPRFLRVSSLGKIKGFDTCK